MSDNNGCGCLGCLSSSTGTLLLVATVILVILKLTGTIAWSWWAVTAPIWVPFALTFCSLLGALFIGLIFLMLFSIAVIIGLIIEAMN